MEAAGLLAGVDDVPWPELRSAFGTSNECPGLLRTVAAGGDGADEAAQQLGDLAINQGTLYEVTAHLVPFLARSAAARIASVDTLYTLGAIGECDDTRQEPGIRGKSKAAFAQHIGLLLPLLSDAEDVVRRAATRALPQSGAAGELVPVLRDRWTDETSLSIKASILMALSFLDPAGTGSLAAQAFSEAESGLLQHVAVHACMVAGLPWSAELLEGAIASLTVPADDRMDFPWDIPYLHSSLVERGDKAAALALVTEDLTRSGTLGPRDRLRAIWRAESLMDSWRGSVHALGGPLASFIRDDDPDIGVTAIETLGRNGVTSPVSDELAALADVREPDARAVAALKCLAEIRDPRFPILIARDFPVRAAALDTPRRASALDALVDAGKVPFDPALLEAVRENLRLTRQEARWQLLLLKLLGRWGSAARSAIPDVLAVLPNHEYQVGCTLADLSAVRQAVPLLSTVASTDSTSSRIGAAEKLRSLTGDEEPLIDAIEWGLDQPGRARIAAVAAARKLTSPIERLVPALTAMLHSDFGSPKDFGSAQREVTLAIWQHAGDPAPAIEFIVRWVNPAPGGPPKALVLQYAPEVAAALGPAGRPLVPLLLPLLDPERERPDVVRALLRIDPDSHCGFSLDSLVDRLLNIVVTASRVETQLQAIHVLAEIGVANISPEATVRLHELADQEEWLASHSSSSGLHRSYHDDDQLRAALHQFLGDEGP